MSEILNCITNKKVLQADPVKPEGPIDLYSVYGTVNSVRADSTNFGAYFKLQGNFEAVRLSDGVIFRASSCILPEPIGNLLGSQLLEMQRKTEREVDAEMKDKESGETIKYKKKVYDPLDARFAYFIGMKPAKNAFGYQWTATPIEEPAKNDPLADLRAKIKGLLPAPKIVSETAKPVTSAETTKKK
jgi:hypothetical protein